MSQAGRFGAGGGGGSGTVISLTGNNAVAVNPDGFGNIDLLGSGIITVTGNAGTHTLTISASGAVATTYDADTGTAVPLLGILNIEGGTGIQTFGAGNTITIDLIVPVSIADGGTNATSMVNTDGVVYYDGTKLNTTTVGTAGQALISNGVGLAPTFQTISSTGVNSITGDTGPALTGNVFLTGGTSGALFVNTAGSTLTEEFRYLAMDDTSPTSGYIQIGTDKVLRCGGGVASGNFFAGQLAGNTTLSGTGNVGVGSISLDALTTALANAAFGAGSATGLTSGGQNVALGHNSLFSATTDAANVAVGASALDTLNTSSGFNTGVGYQSLMLLATGTQNIALGSNSGQSYTAAESSNIIIGNTGTAAESNIIRIGTQGTGAGQQNAAYMAGITGSAVGATNAIVYCDTTGKLGTTGGTFPSLGTTNHAVQVGNSSGGLTSLPVGTNGQLLIGSTGVDPAFANLTSAGGTITYMTGPGSLNLDVTAPLVIAYGGTNATSMTNTDGVVYYDGTKLNTTTVGTVGQVLTSNGVGVAPTYQTPASGGVTSITGNSGTATPSAGVIQVAGGNNITTSGATNVLTVNVSGTTNHAVQVGNSTNSLTSLAVGTNGQVLLGSTGANPAFGTLTSSAGTLTYTTGAGSLNVDITAPVAIAYGGTNATSMATTDGTIYFDGTRLVTTVTGTSGQVLTSNGAGLAPTYQTVSAGGVTSLAGDSGGSLTGALTLTGGTSGAKFAGSGTTLTESFNFLAMVDSTSSSTGYIQIGTQKVLSVWGGVANNNIFVGEGAGSSSTSGIENASVGGGSLASLTTGGANSAVGYHALNACTSGSDNVAVGEIALASLTSGINNVAIGQAALDVLLTGGYNVSIGEDSGSLYVGAESSNILINNAGVASESNVIRIGTQGTGNGQQNTAYMAGITGSSVGVTNALVYCDNTGKLGTTGGTFPSLGTTNHAVQVGNSSGGLTSLTVGTNGQVLVGSTGANPTFATLTSTGGSITYTTGAGTLNLDLTAPVSIANGGTNATSMTNTDGVVYYDGTRLVTTTVGTAAQVLTSNGPAVAPTFQSGTSIPLGTTNHAVQVGNASGTLTSLGIGTTGQVLIGSTGANPAFGALGVNSGLTAHGVLLGENNSAIVATTAGTNGQVLVGSTGADPVFATLTSSGGSITYTTGAGTLNLDLTAPVSIANGGTNATSMTNTDGVVYYNGTRLVTTTVGTAGQVLTSNGAGVAPTFQAGGGGGVTSITGNSGGALTGALTLTGGTSGATFAGSGTTLTESFTFLAMSDSTSSSQGYIQIGASKVLAAWPGVSSNNIFVGQAAGLATTTTTGSTGVGSVALAAITSGTNNTAIGYGALQQLTTSSNNVAVGEAALNTLATGTGGNVAIGLGSLGNITTGVSNTAIGNNSGTNYTGSESSNVLIKNNGTAAESNVIRIGTQGSSAGQQNACYVAGITGATVGATNGLVYCDNTGKLGTLGAIYSSSHYSTTLSVTTATPTAIKFDTDDLNVGSIAHPDISAGVWTQFAAPTGGAGFYMVTSSIFVAGSTGLITVYFQVNGVTTVLYGKSQLPGVSNSIYNNSALIYLNAGDYVQLIVNQSSGGNLNFGSASAANYTRLQIARLM